MWAASSGNCELGVLLRKMCKDSLQDESDPRRYALSFLNHRNKDGRTALMFACKYGHLEFARYLITQEFVVLSAFTDPPVLERPLDSILYHESKDGSLRTQQTIESNSLLQQNLIGCLIANLKRNLRGQK